MEITTKWLEVVGLAIALTLVSYIFVRGVTLTLRGKHHPVRFGIELLFVFTLLYIALERVFNLLEAGSIIEPVDNAIAFLWWVSLAYTINASLNRFVWNGLLAEKGVRKVPKLLTDATALLVYGSAIMIVLHNVYDKSIVTILATSGALAFIVGLSAQSTLSEVFSGLSLNITKALRLGDFVEIDDIYGEVYEINWRSVSLLNPHTGSLYIFPNSQVAAKVILNFSEPTDLFKYYIKFWVEYSASPELVISTISKALEKTRYVRRDPKPDFNILGFTDQGMEYRVRYYFDGDDPWWDAQNEMCMTIWSSLRQKGIRLAIDRHELLSGDEQKSNPWITDNLTKPDEKLVELIAKNPFLAELTTQQLETLSDSASFLDYTPPDCIYREGDHNESVYYIAEGSFSVLQTQPDGKEALIGEHSAGDCVGLPALLTNSPSECKATVRAEQYSRVYALDRELLNKLVTNSPEMQSLLKRTLDLRKTEAAQNLIRHNDRLIRESKEAHRATVNLHLKSQVEDMFSKPLLHQVLHLFSSKSAEHDLLEALMAAAALIASARGDTDEADKKYLANQFEHVELFKHVELDEAIKLFARDVQNIQTNQQEGIHTALSRLRAISKEPVLASAVMGVAHGVADLHSDHSVAVEEQLLDIAQALDLQAEIEFIDDELSWSRFEALKQKMDK
jgi:small-conductance mechanosensitive channel/CRP-like cAMP-binding protein